MERWTDSNEPRHFNERERRQLQDLIRNTVRATVEVQGSYHERGGNSSWQKWILTILGGLVVVAVTGVVIMYGQLSALTQKVTSLQEQVDRVEKIVEPRYRGE